MTSRVQEYISRRAADILTFQKRESLGEHSHTSSYFAPGFVAGFVDRCHQLTRPLSFDAALRAKRRYTLAAPSFTAKVVFFFFFFF